MRSFPYPTLGTILDEINQENLSRNGKSFRLARPTYHRLEQKLNLPKGKRTSGGWRSYTDEQVLHIKKVILKNYNLYQEPSLANKIKDLVQYRLGIQL